MAKIIKKSSIEAVKSRVKIVPHAETLVSLRQSGDFYIGASPLVDNDTEESLRLDPARNRFTCKASGKSGDVIDYEMALGHTGFVETVEFLAQLNGIELEYEEGRGAVKRQKRAFQSQSAA